MIENNTKLNSRRQVGLEINTNLSKTNAFFNTEDLPTPRPPPSISRKISIKKNTPMNAEPEENRYGSYTSRFRNLMTSARQASVAPAPIPQYLNKKAPEESPSPTASLFSDDKIMALPTPKPSSSGEMKKKFMVTKEPEHIPVISCLSPTISTKMPKLSDEPILGDYIEQPIRREQLYEYNNTTHVLDEDIVGKQIGSYRISRLLGVGAFSKVYVGDNLKEKKFYAVKTIQKGNLLNDPRIRSSIEREMGILKVILLFFYLSHPC